MRCMVKPPLIWAFARQIVGVVQVTTPDEDAEVLGLRVGEVVTLPNLHRHDVSELVRLLEDGGAAQEPYGLLGGRLVMDDENG